MADGGSSSQRPGKQLDAKAAVIEFFRGFFDDAGAPYALELMQHYVTGGGQRFVRGRKDEFDVLGWRKFMADRPEIQREMRVLLEWKVLELGFPTKDAKRGKWSETIRGVKLDELQSMRLTLHGCHRIESSGEYEVSDYDQSIWSHRRPVQRGRYHWDVTTGQLGWRPERQLQPKLMTFYNLWFKWMDKGDLHDAIETYLDSGDSVSDDSFHQLAEQVGGQEYDIEIHFKMPGLSLWRYNDEGDVAHLTGWPFAKDRIGPARFGRCRPGVKAG